MATDYATIANKIKTGATPTTGSTDYAQLAEQIKGGTAPSQAPRVLAPSGQLKTPAGLQNVATRAGLGDEAARILGEKGEDPEKILSGGFISDIFDVLNGLQYGVTGVLQGKSFVDGVKTRASFTKEKELQEAGVPGLFAGVALDIAVDPLTYIAPWTAVTKIGKALKLVEPAQKLAGAVRKSRVGQELGSHFIYRFGQDPVYRAMDERRIRNSGVAINNMVELARPIAKLDPRVQRRLFTKTSTGAVVRRPLSELKKVLSPETYKSVREAWSEIDKLGNELVKLGVIPRKVYQANIGEYVRNVYRTFETPKVKGEEILKGVFPAKPTRLDLSFLKKRKDLPEDVRVALGQVLEAGYPTADTLVRLSRAVEDARFFKDVAAKFGKSADAFVGKSALRRMFPPPKGATKEVLARYRKGIKNMEKGALPKAADAGFEQLPVTARLGALSGKFVPKPIADSINEITRVPGSFEKNFSRPIIGSFKYAKVILNPATHARNIMSNFILNSFEGMNPLDPRALKAYATAGKEIATNGKWYKEARQAGLGMDTYAAQEIKGFLDAPEIKKLGDRVKGSLDQIANMYQKEEEFAKLSQYIFQRQTRGLSPSEAWKVAERATFNYAQVTPTVRYLREALFGFPFITFTYKATPQVLKTAARNPTRISNIGKIKNAIENQSDIEELKRERAVEPEWIKDGFYVRLPFKDKYGRSAYFDLTYIIPFGDLVSGQYLERTTSRETGLKEGLPRALARKSPVPNFLAEVWQNQDFYGNKVFLDSDPLPKQLADVFRHLTKTFLPPLLSDQVPGGYRPSGERRPGTLQRVAEQEAEEGVLEGGGGSVRSPVQEMLRSVGFKITPFDVAEQEQFTENDKIKALQALLEERGIIKRAKIPFTPRGQ